MKNSAKFPATTHGYCMAKITLLDDALLEVFEWEASPVKGQSLQQKDKNMKRQNHYSKKIRKRTGTKKNLKNEEPDKRHRSFSHLNRNFGFCACPSKNCCKAQH